MTLGTKGESRNGPSFLVYYSMDLCFPCLSSIFQQKYNAIYVINLNLSCVKFAQSHLTLCDPMDYTVHGILRAGILEWVAFSISRGSSQPRIESRSPALRADSLPAEPQGKPLI